MKIDGKHYRTIWLGDDGWSVEIIDQTKLPHRFETIHRPDWERSMSMQTWTPSEWSERSARD